MPKASGLEAELKDALDDPSIRLIEGSGGVFDVRVDGRLVFSKDETGRFPQEGEVTALIRKGR